MKTAEIESNKNRFELEFFQEIEPPEPVPHTKEKRIKFILQRQTLTSYFVSQGLVIHTQI